MTRRLTGMTILVRVMGPSKLGESLVVTLACESENFSQFIWIHFSDGFTTYFIDY